MNSARTLLLLSALVGTNITWADTIQNLLTGHTGAQTQLDENHESFFMAPSLTAAFTCPVANCTVASISAFDNPAQSYYISGGIFTMKEGPHTVADIALTLYQDGSQVAQINYTESDFCSHLAGTNCQSFSPTTFQFANNYLVTPGHVYYAVLTSAAVDTQSTAYFIKDADVADVNYQGDPNQPLQPFAPSAVPEPGSWFTLAGGFSLIGLARFRRSSR